MQVTSTKGGSERKAPSTGRLDMTSVSGRKLTAARSPGLHKKLAPISEHMLLVL